MKEKDLDKETIDSYQAWVQYGIRQDLNSASLGPGKLPFRSGVFLLVCAFLCLLVGVLLVVLRMKHVYLWDWSSQFLGPFFFILFLLCMAGASYMFLLAKRRSNKYRSELYFQPIGDWGVSCIHKSELALEEELKHELKSGTTPHKTVKPRAEAYSQSSKEGRIARQQHRDGRDNRGYDSRQDDRRRGPPPDGRRGPPPEGRRGPPPDGRRGPPPDGRRGPPPEGRRGPPPDGHRGPPPEGRRGPPPEGRRGPPPEGRQGPAPEGRQGPPPEGRQGPTPEGRQGPPPEGRREGRPNGPPPGYEEGGPNRRSPPDDRRRPPTNGQRTAPGKAVVDDDQNSRPRGVPRFEGVERLPYEDRQVRNMMDRSRDESDI